MTACTWRLIARPRTCSISSRFTSVASRCGRRSPTAGRAEVLDKHTYFHRMERLLQEAEAALAKVVVPLAAANAVDQNGSAQNAHDPFYFGHARPEVLALVPETARAVLDIGCGAGRLGEALKARQQAEVVGVELNRAAAAVGAPASRPGVCRRRRGARPAVARRAGLMRSSAATFSSTCASPSACCDRPGRGWLPTAR